MSLKKSLLVIYEILGLCVNAISAYEKYSVLNAEYLTHPIHMQLSRKKNSQFFTVCLKSRLTFLHITKIKPDTHSKCISKITDFEKRRKINIKKVAPRKTLVQGTW